MTAWRLEWLRLVRTRRLVALAGVYVFFGFVGPLTARYLGEIIDRFGGDEMTVVVPDPVPADGIAQFASNAAQIGVLVAVAVAAGALVVDALPEMSIFLRTRMSSAAALLLPRLVVAAGAIGAAYLVGAGIAWYETAALIGGIPAGGMIGGSILGVLYLCFAVTVVAAIGARLRSVLGTVGTTVVVLLAMPLLGLVEAVGRFLPSHLVGAQVGLITGESLGDYLGAAAVTVAAGAVLVAVAIRATERREL
jgi:ABC-2 type transport system permease protein